MMGTTEAAQDISFEAMKEKQEEVVKIVMSDPAVQAVGSFFGGGFGSAMNNARMCVLDGCGHRPEVEKSQQFIEQVRNFLE